MNLSNHCSGDERWDDMAGDRMAGEGDGSGEEESEGKFRKK
jgi:hypothetical protein